MKKKILIAGGIVAAAAAVALLTKDQKPKKAKPITDFDKKKYLGKWYEIARLPYRWERHLKDVTAEYVAKKDGSIRVINSGFCIKNEKKEEAIGKAKFAGRENVGELKVSFFGPFYSGYNILAVDNDYQNALVAGKNLDYLWLLSRDKEMDKTIRNKYLKLARNVGYDTDKLVWTRHD